MDGGTDATCKGAGWVGAWVGGGAWWWCVVVCVWWGGEMRDGSGRSGGVAVANVACGVMVSLTYILSLLSFGFARLVPFPFRVSVLAFTRFTEIIGCWYTVR